MSTYVFHARPESLAPSVGRDVTPGGTLADHPNGRPVGRHEKLVDLVVQDPVMLEVVERAQRVAASDASVLIFGETGTGKEVIARYIHQNSRRVDGAFVAVNCAAIPEHLLESELFGHERGAFSGAVGQRIGKLEAAHNGTILLDEISEMEKRLQAKLLRAIQEREVDRVGGRSPIPVNVRIIATTNRDLGLEVAKQNFREDLYFRLNVVAVRVPSLRERPGDIITLAEHFIETYRASNEGPPRRLDHLAREALLAHDWPGNVRELENAIHRAMVMTSGTVITETALEIRPSRSHVMSPEDAPNSIAFSGRSLVHIERDIIINTLRLTGGNRTKAAAILGVSIRALRNKLNLYSAQGVQLPRHSAARAV